MKINEVTDVEKKFDKKPFDVYTPRITELADKYDVSTEELMKQVELGVKVEAEHVTEFAVALEIALDHIAEKLDYYEELAKVEEDAIERGSKEHEAYIAKTKELEAQMKEIVLGTRDAAGYTWDQFQTAMQDPEKKAAYDKLKAEFDALRKNTVIKNVPRPSSDNGTAGRYPDAEPGKRYMGDSIEETTTAGAIATSTGAGNGFVGGGPGTLSRTGVKKKTAKKKKR